MNRAEANLLAQLRRRGEAEALAGSRILLAVSGGGDSVALLAFLCALAPSLELHLSVAHADHGLRPESAEDAAFVRELCRHYDLDLVEGSLGVKAHAEKAHLGLETAARDLRWAWLHAEAKSCGASAVATGHTLDDHTETVFLRLQRGSGLRALTPLPPRQGLRWSPLVHLRREALRSYLHAKGLPWREDPTNADPFTPRNRMRPLLQALRREAPLLDEHLLEVHLQVEEALHLAEASLLAGKGTRWCVSPEGLDLLQGPFHALELRWILDRASTELGWPRSATAIRDTAAWVQSCLESGKGGNNGAHELHPMGTGWRLTRRGQPSVG
jgi:tRNA(Ile)-lysidine synthetase-like protein